MQVFEFNNSIEKNPFALSTDSLTICYHGDYKFLACSNWFLNGSNLTNEEKAYLVDVTLDYNFNVANDQIILIMEYKGRVSSVGYGFFDPNNK